MKRPKSRHLLLQIELPARLENLYQFLEAITDCARQQGFQQDRIGDMELALEEILVNIFNYAYQDEIGNAKISCCLSDNKGLIIEIEDSGIPFNVLSSAEPDLKADLSARKVGGLGIYFMKTLMDDVQYRRENNKNILKLIINKEIAKA